LNYSIKYRFIFSLAFIAFISFSLQAQKNRVSKKTEPILVHNADNLRGNITDTSFTRYLNGNVKVYHSETFFFCDTATITDNILLAFGNIVIIQGDSMKIFGDTLYYNGDSLVAKLTGKVLLKNNDKELTTKKLDYHVKSKIAIYDTGARLKQKKSILISKKGFYDLNRENIKFYGNVSVKDPEFKLKTDSIEYDSKNRIAYFIAPTYIDQDSSKIYCESGYYNIKNSNASFSKNMKHIRGQRIATADKLEFFDDQKTYILSGNAEYTEEDKYAAGDTIIYNEKSKQSTLIGNNATYKSKDQTAQGKILIYNEKNESFISIGRSTIIDDNISITSNNTQYSKNTGVGNARGDVIYIDTTADYEIQSSYMDFNKNEDYLLSYGDSTKNLNVIFYSENDTTYIGSDTLKMVRVVRENGDTIKLIKLFNNVRIFSSDYQSIADSLVHIPADSIYHMFGKPVLWSENSQISGDTISILIKKSGIEKLYARNNGFINNLINKNLYNQIQGTRINAYFRDDTLRKMDIDGNAESIYNMEDNDKALTGTVKTVCSSISFMFKDNKINNIKFFSDVKSNLTPIKQEIQNPQRLSGFKWLSDLRPMNQNDLWPKKLKAPLESISTQK
jgi:lipopolysaccharide export system protein LptA